MKKLLISILIIALMIGSLIWAYTQDKIMAYYPLQGQIFYISEDKEWVVGYYTKYVDRGMFNKESESTMIVYKNSKIQEKGRNLYKTTKKIKMESSKLNLLSVEKSQNIIVQTGVRGFSPISEPVPTIIDLGPSSGVDSNLILAENGMEGYRYIKEKCRVKGFNLENVVILLALLMLLGIINLESNH